MVDEGERLDEYNLALEGAKLSLSDKYRVSVGTMYKLDTVL